jgi:hypothetical protein
MTQRCQDAIQQLQLYNPSNLTLLHAAHQAALQQAPQDGALLGTSAARSLGSVDAAGLAAADCINSCYNQSLVAPAPTSSCAWQSFSSTVWAAAGSCNDRLHVTLADAASGPEQHTHHQLSLDSVLHELQEAANDFKQRRSARPGCLAVSLRTLVLFCRHAYRLMHTTTSSANQQKCHA